MKVITDQGISHLEDILFATCTNDRMETRLKFLYSSLIDMTGVLPMLRDKEVEFTKDNKYLLIAQTELVKLFKEKDIEKYFTDERVWPTQGGQLVPTKDMDHQRLSNCCGLLELLLTKGKIDKESADIYLERLEDSVVPELQERFKGEVLPYLPYYEWEKKLVAE